MMVTGSEELLSAALGDSVVLAQPGRQHGQALRLLNPMAAWIWEQDRAGLGRERIIERLAGRFGLAREQAVRDVDHLLDACRANWGAAVITRTWRLRLADRRIGLSVDDPSLASTLEAITRHASDVGPEPAELQFDLMGSASDWQLCWEGSVLATGATADDAIAHTLAQLTNAACAVSRRLLVLHAAGLSRNGRGLLLIGPGGSGKTTLATALNAGGWDLLGDDVIPVTLEGQLLGPGLAPTLKAGSWPVLASRLPALDMAPMIDRFGETVRYPPPPGPLAAGPLPAAAFLVARYQPGQEPHLRPISPAEVLEALVVAEAVVPRLDQERLDTLTRWIASAPGYALVYPGLDEALAVIADALDWSGDGKPTASN